MNPSRPALVFALIALTWSLGYIARTQPLLGPILKPRIVAQLQTLGADAIIQNMRPTGLTSVTFTDVWLRIPKAEWAVEIHADELTVTPSLDALLHGHHAAELLEFKNAQITLKPWDSPPTPRPPKPTSTTTTPRPTPTQAPANSPLRLRIINASIHTEGPLATRAPFKIGRAEIVLDHQKITELSGYGTLPDGVTAAASSTLDQGHMHARVQFDRISSPGTWFKHTLPIHVALNNIDVCPTCTELIQAKDVRLQHPLNPDVSLTVPAAALLRHDKNLELQTQLRDAQAGTLTIKAQWRDNLEALATANNFDASALAAFLGLKHLQPGRLDGTLKATLDLDLRIVEAEARATLHGPTLNVARLSQSPLTFPSVSLDMHALADLKGRTLSVTNANLTLKDNPPITFSGQLLDARKGWRFLAQLEAQNLDPTRFRDALPPTIRDVADNAIYTGSFGFQLQVDGHTAYPNELIVDGKLLGDVAVTREGNVDVQTLSSNGAPPQLLKADLNVWKSYEDLPEYLPRVLLAAEDAAFFGHPGFDWAGFKAAAIHNLEAGSLERGGSTISQQVAKNLFLTPERTIARKLQEAYLTWRMESHVSKQRILEIYLNLADWGGVAGIERAARRYFNTSADQLSIPEVALLAAILPSPTRFGSQIRNGKLDKGRAEKVSRILQNLRFLGVISFEDFNRWNALALQGQIGRLNLTIQ